MLPVLGRRARPELIAPGEDGRSFGDEPGLAGLPPPPLALIGVKEEKAKLRRPDLPSLEVELIDALLPSRRCLRPLSGSAWGMRTIVSLLEDEREGLKLMSECWPHGSEADTEPRLAESRRESEGLPVMGLCNGDDSMLLILLLCREQTSDTDLS